MKAVVFSDIHFGCKNNSDDFNQTCLDFIDYMINKTNDIDTCFFLGDWHHYRSNVGVNTLCSSVEGLKKLSQAYKKVYMIVGNHDMYYRNRLDIHSLVIANHFDNIEIVDKPTQIEECLLLPWLIDGDKLSNYKSKFIFGHAEIPSFYLNKKIKMQGEYNPKDFKDIKKIYLGHFHHRNGNNNILYIGNCFSHDFSDVDDYHNKGFMIFNSEAKSDEELETFIEWEDAPKYMIIKSSELKDTKIPSNAYVKIINDEAKTSREMIKIQTELQEKNNLKNCSIIPTEIDVSNIVSENIEVNKAYQSLDIAILDMLKEVHYDNINNELLQQIYQELTI